MPDPKPEEAEASSEESSASEVEELIATLRSANDVEGLLALAKQYRSGQGVPRDMHACLLAYTAAADLGSPVAQHAVGIFHLNGSVVARDDKTAAAQFRAAADQGHVASKVLVANFYELGIHYRADASKADVWYRNAARAAGIEDEPGTPEHAKAMADLGAVRYCLEIANLPGTSDDEKARLLKLAKTYGHRPEGEGRPSTASLDGLGPLSRVPGLSTPVEQDAATPAPVKPDAKPATETKPAPEKKPARKPAPILPKANVGLGATAFVYTLVFMAVGIVGGHLLDHFAREKVANGQAVPVVGTHAEVVLPIVVGALALLPNMLVYRRSAFFRAALVSAAAGIAGNVLWEMGQRFLENVIMQTTDFAAGGMLLGLLVFGIFGGAKPGSR